MNTAITRTNMSIIDLNKFNPDLGKALEFHKKHIDSDLSEAIETGNIPNLGEFRDFLLTVKDDPTGLALWSSLSKSIRKFGASARYSLDDLSADIPLYTEYSAIRTLVDNSQMTADLEGIATRLKEAIDLLSAKKPSEEFASKLVDCLLSEQTYASKAFKNLRRLTLIEGNTSNMPPVSLCDNIISVNHRQNIFEVAKMAPEGMSLVAVFNPVRVANSYFALIIRSSNNVYYFSDEGHQSFPGQANILRTDRTNMSRMDMSIFPYELFDFDVISNRFIQKKESKELTIIDQENWHLGYIGKISDLDHERLVPLYLLLELVNEELREKPQFPLLHTSKSLALPNMGGTGLIVADNEPRVIKIDSTNAADLDYETFKEKEEAAGHSTANPYPINVFEKRHEKELVEFSIVNSENETLVKSLPEVRYSRGMMIGVTVNSVVIPRINEDLFGTREEVEADQYFAMRETKAEILKAHIYDKYNRESDKRKEWYRNALASSEVALKTIAHLEREFFEIKEEDLAFLEEHKNLRGFSNGDKGTLKMGRKTIFKLINAGRYRFDNNYGLPRGEVVGRVQGEHLMNCVITGQKATLQVDFNPWDSFGIAQLLGVKRTELPYDMEFMGIPNYHANPILTRVDPISNIKLPMEDEHGQITIGFSMKGFNELRTRFGLSKLTKDQLKETLFPDSRENE